jgi:hypothetical protein
MFERPYLKSVKGRIDQVMNIRKMSFCVFHSVGDGSPGGKRRLHRNFLHPVGDVSLRDAVFRGYSCFLPGDAILTDCVGLHWGIFMFS